PSPVARRLQRPAGRIFYRGRDVTTVKGDGHHMNTTTLTGLRAPAAFLLLLCPALASAADDSLSPGINMAWLATASALVFLMQAGFALLEAGMSRAKNALNVVMKNYLDVCVGTVVFWAVGFGLMFGTNTSGWFGTDHFLLGNVERDIYGMLLFQ